MIIANVRVNAVSAEVLSCTPIPREAVGCRVAFEFPDKAWEGLAKTAVFRNSRKTVDAVLEDNQAVIPWEVLTKVKDTVYVGVYGTDTRQKLAIPTVWAKLGQVDSAAVATGDPAAEPSLPIWAQIMEQVRQLEKALGNGDYEGSKGDAPVRGVDYWTEEDKAEIVAESAQAAVAAVGQTYDIVCTAGGESIAITDCASREVKNLRICGKTTQDGTPAPGNPVPLVHAAETGSVTVEISLPEETQTLTVSAPEGLPGIPVTSGGNYIDENGQRWICDEVDFDRGVYIRRVGSYTTNESTKWYANGGDNSIGTANLHLYIIVGTTLNRNLRGTLCDRFAYFASAGSSNETRLNVCRNYVGQGTVLFDVDKSIAGTLEAWKTYAASHPMTVQYILAEPVETPIPAELLEACKLLRTHKKDTAVSNNAGAHVEVAYVADPKTYIDNKLESLISTTDKTQPDGGMMDTVEPEIDEVITEDFIVEPSDF